MDLCLVTAVAMVMFLRNFGTYGIMFMTACVVITVTMVMLLRNFGPYGIILMTVFTTLDFPVILDSHFTNM
jgi:hypothetical protein